MWTLKHSRESAAAILIGAVLLAGTSPAAVVTKRLGTGLPPSAAAGPLPEAWVAPAAEAPKLDGRLDDKVWSSTRPIVFGKLESRGEASPRTEARLLQRDGVLYLGVQLAEPNIDKLRRAVTQPDGPAYQDDSVEVFLEPIPGREYFQFVISAGGGVYDRIGHGDPERFNAKAKAAAAVGKDGWSLEVAIPMSALGIEGKPPTRWRANFYRNRLAGGKGENQAWAPTFSADYDRPDRFGYLLFTPECPWAEQEKTVRQQQGIIVKPLGEGQAVLLFDLSTLPKGAKVYRAELRCERAPLDGSYPEVLQPIEIYPLAAPYKEAAAPKTEGKPLSLRGPWYRSFDMTEVVRGWVGGRGTPGVYVKRFPGWRIERTFLEVMFEGEPADLPPQATGLKAFHRAGQTFLTWKEIDDPVGRDEITWGALKAILDGLDRQREVRYCVYRAERPITAANLHQAERIAEVAPLSCWNVLGRSKARAIDNFIATAEILHWHQWNPFGQAEVDGKYGLDCPMDRLVIAAGQPPLARGTGLYVHTAAKNENAYYAVVTRVDGVENCAQVAAGNSLAASVVEIVFEPQPVLQGELPPMPFFNFKDHRLHYVHWVAAPFSNKPYDYYNWTVGVPEEVAAGTLRDVALELNLHRDGYDYWRTHYRIEPGAIVLCPHDFPLKTWWYGYHEALGTLRPWSEGLVRNYTEKRLLWFLDWAARKWPVDRSRILVTGCRGGASGGGALHLGLRYPEVFNMVIAGHGEPEYAARGEEVQRIWGKPEWNLKTETGRSVWDELDLIKRVQALPPKTELPLVTLTYSNRESKAAALADALLSGGHAVLTHSAWGGECYIPVSANATFKCVPLDVRKNQPLLAIRTPDDRGDAIRNGSTLWQSADLVDQPQQFAATVQQSSRELSGSITLRRLQQFQVAPGKSYAWKLDPLSAPSKGSRQQPQSQQGQVTVGSDGLLVLSDLKIPVGTWRLTITAGKQ